MSLWAAVISWGLWCVWEIFMGSAILAYIYGELTKVALCVKKDIILCAHYFRFVSLSYMILKFETLVCPITWAIYLIVDMSAWVWECFPLGWPTPSEDIQFNGDISLAKRWITEWSLDKSLVHMLKFYYNELDVLEAAQMIWCPYRVQLLEYFPFVFRESPNVWWAMVPMVFL